MKEIRPPQFALRFLRMFCPAELHESIEGDLVEQFEEDIVSRGLNYARFKFLLNTINFFRPGIILRNKFKADINHTYMIGNYFKVATRNILKRKLFSFINAFGLSIGISFCILIFLFIKDERSFDQFHANKKNIYRIESLIYESRWKSDQVSPYTRSAWLQLGLRDALKDELPEIQYATRFNEGSTAILRYRNKVFSEKIAYTDGDFFKMFSFKLLSGNREKLFENKLEVVITPAIALKYFGSEDPLGKVISIDNQGAKLYTVAGVMEAPPANSSFDFKILVPQENRPYYERSMKQWGSFNTPCFVQLLEKTDTANFRANLDKVVQKYMGKMLERWRKEEAIQLPIDGKLLELIFTPLSDVHLLKSVNWHKVSDPQYSYILGGIALLILVIACINYISLALTTSTTRRKEVGVRKVAGAGRNQLIYQFGFESLFLAFISMLFGVLLVLLFLPSFNQFTGKEIAIQTKEWFELLGIGLALTFFVGLFAGSYPSAFLARYQPALVLKGQFTSRLQAGFTKPLVVLQFFLSASLIVCSVIMYRQMKFIATKDLGYSKDQTLVIPTQTGWNEEANKTVERFRIRAQKESGIVSVSGTSSSFNQGYSRYGYKIKDEQKSAYVYAVDPNYLSTLGIHLSQGRNFDATIFSDTTAIIVNEALVKDMKWDDPLSEHLNWREDTVGIGAKVIGVVKDYHFLSLESAIEPMFLSIDKKNVGYLTTLLVKVEAGKVPVSLEKVRGVWKELFPDRPFDYTFLDEDVAKQYESYQHWMSITGLATGFAILISCMGLFGLAGINAVNRTKEIGIRKVLGAELPSIFILLNKQYVGLSLIAFVLAVPISWVIMGKWLESFKFSILMSWDLFAISILLGLIIALATVSYHALKTALVNPAETLKYE
ncbi:MAG: ABC transporter permease [Bacteroidetes bacterium]|nr:ABC transporter permease [Bacteroidota bacterium]